jgi:transposase
VHNIGKRLKGLDMTNEENGSKKYRKFSSELKSEVCKLAAGGLQTYKELGDKFDIPPGLIGRWFRASQEEGVEAFRGRGNRAELEAENVRLRKENNELRQEREILKKAAAYFAKHQA